MNEEALEYHTTRARAELDQAYRATRDDVANLHLRLSLLHMEQAQKLSAADQVVRQMV